ncbi:unnamed protein product [Arctogadus glacialis]
MSICTVEPLSGALLCLMDSSLVPAIPSHFLDNVSGELRLRSGDPLLVLMEVSTVPGCQDAGVGPALMRTATVKSCFLLSQTHMRA